MSLPGPMPLPDPMSLPGLMSLPGWLTAKPIAHRGLHDHSAGRVENSSSAFEAAIAAGFPIETDLQCSADNEPVIIHDPVLDRLTNAKGPVSNLTADQFKALSLQNSDDPMLDLSGLLHLVSNRTPLLIEIKSRAEFNSAFTARIIDIMRRYEGDFALMSFDPRIVKAIGEQLPAAPRGLVASGFEAVDWPGMAPLLRFKLRHLFYAWHSRPHFIAYSINALPAPAPLILKAIGTPLLSWTVDTPQRLAKARRFADNIVFENITPYDALNGNKKP